MRLHSSNVEHSHASQHIVKGDGSLLSYTLRIGRKGLVSMRDASLYWNATMVCNPTATGQSTQENVTPLTRTHNRTSCIVSFVNVLIQRTIPTFNSPVFRLL